MNREALSSARRWVIKLGSALLTADGQGLDQAVIDALAAQMAQLRAAGHEVVLVSSGAVAAGMVRLGWRQRPHLLHDLQAAAAVGQTRLVRSWEQAFEARELGTAQVLLGHDDVLARDRYLNARGTLNTLLALGLVPIVNENDTVVTDEIRFGDNDTLGALVANLIDADALLLLTDQQGLFEADPRENPEASLVRQRDAHDPALDTMVGEGGSLGRGGMITKLRAARLAARSGTQTVIAGGREAGIIESLAAGQPCGTWLTADREPLAARKQWLAGMVQVQGSLQLDEGATRVVQESGRSLLAVGVCEVQGDFSRGDMVACCDPAGREVARGLVNYNADEARRIMGQPSSRIEEILGYCADEELVHRDNLVLL